MLVHQRVHDLQVMDFFLFAPDRIPRVEQACGAKWILGGTGAGWLL